MGRRWDGEVSLSFGTLAAVLILWRGGWTGFTRHASGTVHEYAGHFSGWNGVVLSGRCDAEWRGDCLERGKEPEQADVARVYMNQGR